MTRAGTYRFGEFTLDCSTRQLLHGGESVHLTPKAYELLQVLVEAAPRALSKAQLQDRIWPDTYVIEANLQHLVAEIRRALGETAHDPQFLRTVFGFGYAFQHHPTPAADLEPARMTAICRLGWDQGGVTLADGEYTIGRDGTADVVLDSATVSRRHARLRISAAAVELEDLGSKNGTFVANHRVDGIVTLSDRDDVRFGSVPVTVRIGVAEATQTAVGQPDMRHEP